ncbi:MAG: aryl-sulfate sulfotransferase, partial [Candidatus Thorarchaeota archaeon]
MLRNFNLMTLFLLLLIVNAGTQMGNSAIKEFTQAEGNYGNYTVEISGAMVDIANTPEAFEGYNLFVLLKTHKVTLEREFFLMIVDMNGEVILEKQLPENEWIGDCPAELIEPTTILVRSSNTTALYNITDGSTLLLPFEGHHEFEYNPINDTFFTFHYDIQHIDGGGYLYDTLLEFDREGSIVWSFNVSSLMSIDDECPYQDVLLSYHDVSHSNTIYYDVQEDSIYLMLRNANTFWKIDHSTGEVIWGLGEYGNFTMYNKWGSQTDNLFYHGHAVEPIDEDTFILFDNDYHNQTNEMNRMSRILEIHINEDTMTANTSWVWTGEPEYYSYLWGNADRLPNGNRLGAFGIVVRPNSGYGGRLVEVNEDHDIVWEMSFVNDEAYWYGFYRAQRFRVQPILQLINSRDTYSEGDITLDWLTWFNYRPKRDMQGTFGLYLDGTATSEGNVTFDRYWRPTPLSYTFENLSSGSYNATLVVWDGYGNSVRVTKII